MLVANHLDATPSEIESPDAVCNAAHTQVDWHMLQDIKARSREEELAYLMSKNASLNSIGYERQPE